MKSSQYANYLIVVLTALLLLNYGTLLYIWKKSQVTTIIVAIIILTLINMAVIYSMNKIKVYDKNGKLQNLGDIFGDILVDTVIFALVTIIAFIIGLVVAYRIDGKNGLTIPLISTIILYGSLLFATKIKA